MPLFGFMRPTREPEIEALEQSPKRVPSPGIDADQFEAENKDIESDVGQQAGDEQQTMDAAVASPTEEPADGAAEAADSPMAADDAPVAVDSPPVAEDEPKAEEALKAEEEQARSKEEDEQHRQRPRLQEEDIENFWWDDNGRMYARMVNDAPWPSSTSQTTRVLGFDEQGTLSEYNEMNAKEVCGGHGGQIPKNLTPEKAVTFVTFLRSVRENAGF